MNWFAVPNFRDKDYPHAPGFFLITTLWQIQVRADNFCENFYHANQIWFTVFKTKF